MATVAHLGTATWTTTAGNKTVTATPTAGDLIVVVAPATGVATSSVTDNNSDGLGTYTKIGSSFTGWSTAGDLSIWVRNAKIGSGTSTVFTATQTSSTGGGLDLFRVTGMTLVGSAAVRSSGGQSSGTTGTTPAPVLSQTPALVNPIITAVCNGTSPATITQRTGYTEATDLGYATPTAGLETSFLSSGETSATITYGATSGSAFGSIAIELDTGGALGPTLNSAWSHPVGNICVPLRVGIACSTLIPAVAVAPPPTPTVGPPFYPFRQAVRAKGIFYQTQSGGISAELPIGSGNISGPITGGRPGGGMGCGGAVVRNPTSGPTPAPLRKPVRFILPPWQPRAGRVGSSFGAPVVNPRRGPPVYAPHGPVQARFPRLTPVAGRIGSDPGAPVRNPNSGVPYSSRFTQWVATVPYRTGW